VSGVVQAAPVIQVRSRAALGAPLQYILVSVQTGPLEHTCWPRQLLGKTLMLLPTMAIDAAVILVRSSTVHCLTLGGHRGAGAER
jgi:hypothetical protein